MDIKLILLSILATESVAGGAFVYLNKGRQSFSVRVISAFLLLLGFIFGHSLLNHSIGADSMHPLVVLYSYLLSVFCLALPPTFYLYNVSLVRTPKEILNEKDILVHYYPAIALLAINLFSFIALYRIHPESKNYLLLETVHLYCNFISLFFLFLLQNVYYIYASWKLYFKQKMIVQTSQSKASNLTIWWMRWFILLYTILIVLLYLFLKPLVLGKVIFRLFTLCYVSLVIYYGRNNYKFELEIVKTDEQDSEKRTELKATLIRYMEEEKPYLQEDLTLKSLAHSIETNSKYLSHLINKEFDCNFSSYINTYRIKEAKRLLSDAAYNIYTIESIAKMTGFKSKSTFNSTFKKQTNLTPSQFKQQTSC